MNIKLTRTLLAALALASGSMAFADATLSMAPQAQVMAQAPSTNIVINGTGSSQQVKVNLQNLPGDVTLKATNGLSVYPAKIPASIKEINVTVTLTSTMPTTTGQVILRSGDHRAYINVTGYGTPLEQKDLSQGAVFTDEDTNKDWGKDDGFNPDMSNGYTVEFKVNNATTAASIDAYAVTPDGGAFKMFVDRSGIGFYNGGSRISFENPASAVSGGAKAFYNDDNQAHTYRVAVTSDKRAFVYRDGQLVTITRTQDYGNQPEWAIADGGISQNLIKNGDFEGEWNQRVSDSLLNKIEGWHVDPIDQYNCNYFIQNQEVDNDKDMDNHVVRLQRYNWNDGWGAGTVSQIIDVVPNSTYSLTALAGGGMDTKSGTNMSSLRIEEVENPANGTKVTVTNEEGMETYSLNYTTSANCNQIKVILHNERFLNGGGWGSSPKAFLVDDVTLVGKSRVLDQKVGFDKTRSAALDYFTFDPTGAYAPVTPVLAPEVTAITLDGTGASKTINVNIANLVNTDPITVTATPGIKVEPSVLAANQNGTITVTLLSSLPETEGKVTLRCGDLRTYIDVKGFGSDLEAKDLSAEPTYKGEDKRLTVTEADGFTIDPDKGYTVEFRARIKSDAGEISAYAVTKEGASFNAFVEPEALGLANLNTHVGINNPATEGTGGKGKFYNNDGKYHTYRYAVTPDQRVFIYRDGMLVSTQRAADYCHDTEWLDGETAVQDNLLKNPGFEGEWNTRADGLVNKVEGWYVDPIDQYNCNYLVINREINNEYDHNNHVMKLQRYNWNDGWGAGTVSQIVDVVPGQTYSLTALAGGGMNTKTGEIMSSLRIQEVQNPNMNAQVKVTNEEGFEEYSLTYTASADCNQLKVILHNERFVNGGGWGSSPKEFLVDNMKLTGMGRTLKQQTGFHIVGSELEYFTYDLTGAYAPMAASFGDDFTGIESAAVGAASAWVESGMLFVGNINPDATVTVYNSLGQTVASIAKYDGQGIKLPAHGVYVCVASLGSETRTFKVAY